LCEDLFVILNLGYWDLFVIWDLLFGIYISSQFDHLGFQWLAEN